jgi:hypothetical protein
MAELKKTLDNGKTVEESLRDEVSRNTHFLKLSYEIRSCLKIILIFLTSSVTKNNAEEVKRVLINDEKLLFSSTVKQLDMKINDIIDILKQSPTIKLQEQAKAIKPIIIGIRDITRDRYNNAVLSNIDSTINQIMKIDESGQTFYIEGNKLYIEEQPVT